MDLTTRSERIKDYLATVAPKDFLERPNDTLESMSESPQVKDSAKVEWELLQQGKTLETTQPSSLEAIIHKQFRPAIDVIEDSYHNPTGYWKHLGDEGVKGRIEKAILGIGRVDVPGAFEFPYAGTGFVVGPGLIMTNRHVAEIFAMGLGVKNLSFRPGLSTAINFRREVMPGTHIPDLTVDDVVMIHPYWDMAILKVSGLPEERTPLTLSTKHPDDLADRDIVVVGYPAEDDRNDFDLQMRIYKSIFGVKRLQPGKTHSSEAIESFDHQVRALTHDASTLGGCSGSAVIDIDTGQVLGLHFAGIYLKANFCVPTFELARDQRVVDLGLSFDEGGPPSTSEWDTAWRQAENPEELPDTISLGSSPPATTSQSIQVSGGDDGGITFTIPLKITISLGEVQTALNAPQAASVEGISNNEAAIVAEAYQRFDSASLEEEFDWTAALSACSASHVVYRDGPAVESICVGQWGFEQCDFIQVNDTECFVAANEDTILVSYRGTAGVRDWVRDLTVYGTSLPYGRVHRGFYHGFAQARFAVEQAIDQIGVNGRQLVICGHSLGGALATIAAAEWTYEHRYALASVYTFGQPAVGKGDFVEFVQSTLQDRFFRFVNDDDIITKVPPTYRHIGTLKKLNGRMTESIAPASDTMSEGQFLQLQQRLAESDQAGGSHVEGLLPSFSDHKLANYMRKIIAQLS